MTAKSMRINIIWIEAFIRLSELSTNNNPLFSAKPDVNIKPRSWQKNDWQYFARMGSDLGWV
jgi:hypothetical protein